MINDILKAESTSTLSGYSILTCAIRQQGSNSKKVKRNCRIVIFKLSLLIRSSLQKAEEQMSKTFYYLSRKAIGILYLTLKDSPFDLPGFQFGIVPITLIDSLSSEG